MPIILSLPGLSSRPSGTESEQRRLTLKKVWTYIFTFAVYRGVGVMRSTFMYASEILIISFLSIFY